MRKTRRTRFSPSRAGGAEIRHPADYLTISDGERSAESFSRASREEDGIDSGEAAPRLAPDDQAPPSWLRMLNSRRPRQQKKPRLLLISLGCLALGLIGGLLLAKTVRMPSADRAKGGAAGLRLPENEQARLDAAYNASYLRHYPEAEALFATLGKSHPEWGLMQIEQGRILLYEGKLNSARTILNQATTQNSTAADAYFMLAVICMVQTDYVEAQTNLAAAVANDPTRSEFYYLWGDCLRAEGKPLQALAMFRSALIRNRYETANGLYRLKAWLSEIDTDQENNDGLSAAITTGLAQPLPPMEILFAAAARDLKAGDFRLAAEHIRRARERTDPDVFHIVLNDTTFDQVRHRPEMVDLFPPAPADENPTPTPGATVRGK